MHGRNGSVLIAALDRLLQISVGYGQMTRIGIEHSQKLQLNAKMCKAYPVGSTLFVATCLASKLGVPQ